MPLFNAALRARAEAISHLVYCNPFLPDRIEAEQQVLGDDFVKSDVVWNASKEGPVSRPNVARLITLAKDMCQAARDRLASGAKATAREAQLYEDLVMHVLYYRRHAMLERVIRDARAGRPRAGIAAIYDDLVADLHYFLRDVPPTVGLLQPPDAAHLLAAFFQLRRAFDEIFHSIVGTSLPAARLRAAIWESIFTHDMRRYRRSLYDKTGDFTTLVIGPSGTGKELVARAIGASRYIPFDPRRKTFTDDFAASFFALNLSALSPTLVESELFGHRRGAFTGAGEDRPGWLQTCPPLGTVFLDEIGELDPAIQVKLLRVLQTRTFQRLGDTRNLEFKGKIIAATNRDLSERLRQGEFRHDFYYRLCADVIRTPSLREQIAGNAQELRLLVHHVAQHLLPDEADALTDEAMRDIAVHLGPEYAWPGNFRELEQCVRNVLMHGAYQPHPLNRAGGDGEALEAALRAGTLTADELLSQYCAHVYRLAGTYEAAAKRLGMDRRTVRARAGALR